ncbi:hypothetical protein [Alicyclobacillus fastidiosus]|uniref:PepSY domain-containing protein n=1 Tax=Alicyclobacillus fastidiosus TaxID=392011 RepID=A0ABV5AAI1_9BACL|nr:hypothetical protein [Alicyclobacillus fastidiosus]WEH07585.1 hypothetical protein PYS47_12460 [Alicyclobacillus fastidiosus]
MRMELFVSVALALFATGCAAPSVVAASHPDGPFQAPTVIQAPTIASDSPGQSWNFPNDPATVILNIYKWLSSATVTTVQIPTTNHAQFEDYIGPAELYFTDQNSHQIVVYPAFYIAHDSHGYYPALIKNVVVYKDGNHVQYLNCPRLFQWLGHDDDWGSQYRMEAYTDADQKAIHDAKASKWGGHLTNIFPAIPGINKRALEPGPSTAKSGSTIKPIPGTVESLVDQEGANRKVTFIEVWHHGTKQHRWTYIVAPSGTILSHTQSGQVPLQAWK